MTKQQALLRPRRQQRRPSIARSGMSSLLLLIILLVWSEPIATVFACSCPGGSPMNIQSSIANSQTAVFATILDQLTPPTNPSQPQYYRADADGVIKGCKLVRDTIFYIKTPSNSGLCGVTNLQPGVRYILFGTVVNEATVYGGAMQTVLTIDSCKAQNELARVDRATQTFLYNQPIANCNTDSNFSAQQQQQPAPAPIQPIANVNCQVCPNGFYDGCNTCGCNAGFATACSRLTCTTLGRAACTNGNLRSPTVPAVPPAPIPPPVRPPQQQPVVSAPVFREWPPLPNFNTVPVAPRPSPIMPRPVAVVPVPRPSPVGTVLRPGTVSCASCRTESFYDGCNTCTCLADGRRTCTRRVCTSYQQAVCGRVSQPVPPPPAPVANPPSSPQGVTINCQTCPNGYNDGCNTCGCSTNGAVFCSNKSCQVRRPLQCN